MATTTPNFGWPVPTSTDLVKNGATAIEGLGDAIDASLLDLKGGTTGQVLAKATNTDMDFSWVAQDDSNAIQNAIVDAKGDLIAASANDTPARLAVGNNGETLVADSSTSTGLKWGFPNAVGCSLVNSTTQTISTGTQTALTWDSEYYDSHGFHSTSSNTSRITIPAGLGGKYLIQGVFAYGLSATGSRDSNFRINGTTFRYWPQLLGSSVVYVGPQASFVLALNAGDYIEITTTQNSGGNLTAFTANDNGNFSATYLGA